MEGQFIFIKEQYFKDFPDSQLMKNKEIVGGKTSGRPCFLAFEGDNNPEILWCVPISSQVSKYKKVYDDKMQKFGKCNTIRFGEVLGQERAFLIQNMFPITRKYIKSTYMDKNTSNPVTLPPRTEKDVVKHAKQVLNLYNIGKKIIFPNVSLIENVLSQGIAAEKEIAVSLQPNHGRNKIVQSLYPDVERKFHYGHAADAKEQTSGIPELEEDEPEL